MLSWNTDKRKSALGRAVGDGWGAGGPRARALGYGSAALRAGLTPSGGLPVLVRLLGFGTKILLGAAPPELPVAPLLGPKTWTQEETLLSGGPSAGRRGEPGRAADL